MDIFHSGLYLSWNGFLHHQFTEYNTVCSDTHAPLVCMSRCIICILICLSDHLTFCVQYNTGVKKCSFYDIRTPAVYTGNVGRSIDVPGYDKIDLHPAARFIGTMNYGYAGTKELNEALVSRFLVIDMPAQNEETLGFIFNRMFPDAKKEAVEQFMGVFLDLQQKSMNSEISTKPLDLRGLLAAMKIVRTGLSPWQAVRMGIVNKTFDVFEKEIVEDVVRTRIPQGWTREDVYGE